MKRLMSFARNLGSETREAWKCFPLTMSAVFAAGILICVVDRMGWLAEQILSGSAFFFFLFAVGSFLAETVFEKKSSKFWYLESCILLVTAIGTWLFTKQGGLEFLQENGIVWGGIGRYLTGYCLTIGILSAYIWFRRSGFQMEVYCMHVFQQVGKVTVTFVLIALGCVALSQIFSFLILDRKDFHIADMLVGLTVTFYYIPALSLIWKEHGEKPGVFVERMVKFVFFPISTFAGIIMYLYMVKILIPFTIPSNQIFRMVTVLFAGGTLTWTLLSYYEEDSWYMRLAEKLPYFYLPFLVIQGYTLGIRLALYGMTPNRYLGIMILVFEFLYMCFYRMQKEQIGNILPVFAVLIFCATWVPGVNLEDVSIRNQKAIAEQYYTQDEAGLSQDMWRRIYGAYLWLSEQPECTAYAAGMFPETVVEDIQLQSGMSLEHQSGEYWLYDTGLVQSMNVSEYQLITPVHSVQKAYGQNTEMTDYVSKMIQNRKDMTNVICMQDGMSSQDAQESIVLNLQEIFDDYIGYYQKNDFQRTAESHRYMEEHNLYQLSENQAFYVDSIEVVLNPDKLKISRYSISGYLMEK